MSSIPRLVLGAQLLASAAVAFAEEDCVRHVNTLVGTVAEGNCFPGACRPFGMVQASPDSGRENRRVSGFCWEDDVIRSFSQTHANGTGRCALGDGAFMPIVGETDGLDVSSSYDKSSFVASPDYLKCHLKRYGITLELTASDRVGWYRIAYPKGKRAKVFLDTAAYINQPHMIKYGPMICSNRTELAADRTEVRIERRQHIWEEGTVASVVRFSRPWRDVADFPVNAFMGKGRRMVLDFGELEAPLEVQVAMSSVSAEGASKNLATETKGETFESVRRTTRAAWNEILGRIELAKGSDDQKRNWYTAAYHLCIQPNLYSDVDGRYTADDGTVKVGPNGKMYTMFSLWDTFRAAHPMYSLLVPERMGDFMASIWRQGEDHGHLPMWVMWGRETHDMIGVHSIPVLVDAYAKGWRPADGQTMLREMIRTLTANDAECPKNGFNAIFDWGYISYDPGPFHSQWFHPSASVSRTLEISYDWWCVAHFARMLGSEDTARQADRYAASWRNLYDASTGFMRAKASPLGPDRGKWREPFDPLENRQTDGFWGDYTEANAYVYTWHVFQEPDAFAELMGGREKALGRLDEFFSTCPKPGKVAVGNNDEGGVIRPGQIGQYWHGNEPSHHIAYFYTLLGEPDKAAALVRRICDETYLPKPDGLCGNDDCGQMSAWYLFSCLGFYPFNPCDDGYVFGAPQAEEMRLALPGGKTLTVRAAGLSPECRHVASVTLNGRKLDGVRLSHGDLLEGGALEFTMK